ncbi:RidA family protein, partial [Enterococcus faecalis]|uniref:RidA family protein n=1 Tax=Enterococcus faecalis TaxID=1351 RepID=UPI00403F2907
MEKTMTDTVADALAAAGLVLPQPAAPVAAYVPTVLAGGLLHVSGQLPFVDGQLVTGRLGETVSVEQGQAAAQACGLMLLAQVKAA